MQKHTHSQDVVLIGGGHSHLELLRQWARAPVPGVRLTLVSPQVQSAYSPMVSGMIAGHYSHCDVHIDLPRLCRAAGARFIQACAHHIDPLENRVSLLGRPDLDFDYLSLAVGASPCHKIPGSELAIPVKPISQFYRYWEQLKQQVYRNHQPLKLGIIGGGAGGCELAMALAWALEEPVYSGRVEIHLVQSSTKIPADYPLLARRLAAREMARLKVKCHPHWRVSEITPRGIYSDEGQFLALDKVLLCTESAAPPWLTQSGLTVDDGGFVAVDDYLRSSSHPHVFAAGDVASSASAPSKSAAEARNQGPVLYHNLRASVLERPLKPYRPQRKAIRHLSCGGQQAVTAHGGIAAASALIWHWKDHRDRQFLRRINQLPVPQPIHNGAVPAAGASAGAEITLGNGGLANDLFQQALSRLTQPEPAHGANSDIHTPLNASTSLLHLPTDKQLVQSSEQLNALVQDPWLLGRLLAQHTLTRLFAVHAQPLSAQALVTLPTQIPGASPALASRDLLQILDGLTRELNQYHCTLSGGQLIEGQTTQMGLTINGAVDGDGLIHNGGVRAGDCLIVTKPLGSGALFAAEAQGRARARWLQQALDTMLQSNATAAEIFVRNHTSAMHSIDRHGLLGQLLELLPWQANNDGAPLGASLFADALPFLPGATFCAEQGLRPDQTHQLHQHNARSFAALQNPGAWHSLPHLPMLVDPQICGGLLGAVPAANAEQCLAALHAAGCRHAAIVGVVASLPSEEAELPHTLTQPVYLARSGDWKKLAADSTAAVT